MERPDWDQNIFRDDLWVYREGGGLTQLTQSGHDNGPQWSPDGRWIAFYSQRKSAAAKPDDKSGKDKDNDKDDGVAQLYLISPAGGEAFPVTQGDEEARRILLVRRLANALLRHAHALDQSRERQPRKRVEGCCPLSWRRAWRQAFQHCRCRCYRAQLDSRQQARGAGGQHFRRHTGNAHSCHHPLARGTDGHFAGRPPPGVCDYVCVTAGRKEEEKISEYEIYLVDVEGASADRPARQLTHNQALERHLRWSPDSRFVLFTVDVGDVGNTYRDLQPHLYRVDTQSGEIEQWAKEFMAPVHDYEIASDKVFVAGRLGTEVPLFSAATSPGSIFQAGRKLARDV